MQHTKAFKTVAQFNVCSALWFARSYATACFQRTLIGVKLPLSRDILVAQADGVEVYATRYGHCYELFAAISVALPDPDVAIPPSYPECPHLRAAQELSQCLPES